MLYIVLFILCCWGCTQIVVYGKIFEKLRNKKFFEKVMKCSMCSSWWVGVIVYLLFYFSNIKLFPNLYIGIFVFANISSATSYALCQLIDDNGIRIGIKDKK